MRQIVIFTMGTRGDVQPYIYLAQALIRAGYNVAIGTHPCWERLVADAGVSFLPIGPDVDIQREAAVIRGRSKNPMISMLRTMNFVFKIIQSASPDIQAACRGQDLVIVSHSQMGATEAEALGVPIVNVTLQVEMLPQPAKPKTLGDRLFAALINPQMVRPYNKIRRRYQLPRVKSMDQVLSPTLNLIPISRYVVEPSPYWGVQNHVVGYWFDDSSDYQPDDALAAFLRAGDPPLILALGAMSFESAQERDKLDLFVRAFEQTGMRALIQGFNKTLEGYPLPASMMRVGSVPHSWLFQQGYAVLHHCGFGTSAAAMLCAIPSIPIPHVLDQFAFAQRIESLGVGVAPIKASELSQARVVAAIQALKARYPELRQRAQLLAGKMRAEDGLRQAVRLIQGVVGPA